MGLYVLKVQSKKERLIIEQIVRLTERLGYKIYSAAILPKLKGYLVIEGDNDDIQKIVPSLLNVHRIVGEMKPSELDTFLTKEEKPIQLNIGDKVQILKGAFKNDFATVKAVNEAKKECTLELQNTFVSIPLTLKTSEIKKVAQDDEDSSQ
ncbi:MAG: transcription elongation factor Spt5 [Candidatus Huberarchaeum crystalense]|uniref:Transcription elongation factor Spt5 n=1 Tax=Huberarchaeum crystalense TaxID=2014257 RepID=A0A2G9LJV3_HUBC1|nr:transcription elongation factor Spt5 [archaeon]OIP20294.1 MAG: transcription elongation factor Spt5 [archaeon CG2_30_31_98]PIN66460.1 MAG: transcription elongation factor Spt5 [Candidatus Huberarchaeum crystalense]NCS98170.1 transcription elongation factor Spt5 [archaeon]PIV13730.1 MAG: transcription elongation factor Spt5 [Candidatus Huberarchaeum crystalense]